MIRKGDTVVVKNRGLRRTEEYYGMAAPMQRLARAGARMRVAFATSDRVEARHWLWHPKDLKVVKSA